MTATLRADRRRRLFSAMEAHGLDVLVLGRPAEVAFATGARQLWTAGTRPFGPACIAVGETQRTHLLSTWDAGVPPEIGHDDLFGLSWNPANIAKSLAAIPGLRTARRVGTTSSTPGFGRLLSSLAPDATLVDGLPALVDARRVKSDEEVACINEACAIAEAGLAAAIAALRAGVSERELLAAYLDRIASLGAPNPPSEAITGHPVADRVVTAGDAVPLDAGALYEGYEGGVGRTWVVGEPTTEQRSRARRCAELQESLVASCRPGATGADLVAAWDAAGAPRPDQPIAFGIGLGAGPPVIGPGIGLDAALVPGMVLSVGAAVDGFTERDIVLVTDTGPRRLSRYGRGPAGEETE